MRKRRKSTTATIMRLAPRPAIFVTFLHLIVLSLLWLIVKIGQVPQKVGQLIAIQIHKKRDVRRKRGRPRTTPFFQFHLRKLKKVIDHLIPRTIRLRIILGALALLLLGYSFIIIKAAVALPSPYQLTNSERPLTTQILDRNGKILYQFYDGRNRKLIKLEELPPNLINATIAIEDKHFYSHPGIDLRGIARAIKANIQGEKLEGGSTITQQLVKNTLLTPDQTFTRKAKEAVLAFWVERIYSKKEILQMYFNESPYGGPNWGIETASETYFGKPAKDLNLAESAFLAGLPAAPTNYSPYGIHPEQGKERQKRVLGRMVENNYITQKQADEAGNEILSFREPTQNIKAPHFVMYIRSILAAKYGEKAVSTGGFKVITTLDLDMQEMAENVVETEIDNLKNLKVGNSAAVVTDAQNGEILAMIGSKNYFDPNGGNFNVALALRQPGSSIKPITYVTGFKMGYSPATILLDVPTTFPNSWGKPYSPVNYDGRFHGPVSIRTALGSSYNVPAVKMLATVGIPEMLKTARDMGITTLTDTSNYGLSLTLGGGGVKLLEMMDVYGTLASGGVRFEPNPILQITDSSGNTLEDNHEVSGRKVLTEEVAYLINNILSDNNARTPAFGTNSLLNINGHTVAAKTGTSDDKRDNWTFGYTPKYVVGVWVGNNDNSPMDPKLTSGITGAAPIWHNIMTNLLFDQPNLAFNRPAGIIESVTNGHRDLAIKGETPKTVIGYRTIKQKDGSGIEKDVTLFTDPFSTFTSTQSAQLIPTQTTQ